MKILIDTDELVEFFGSVDGWGICGDISSVQEFKEFLSHFCKHQIENNNDDKDKISSEKQPKGITREQCETVLYLMRFILKKNGFVSVKDLDDIYDYLGIPLYRLKRTCETTGWRNLDTVEITNVTKKEYVIKLPLMDNR